MSEQTKNTEPEDATYDAYDKVTGRHLGGVYAASEASAIIKIHDKTGLHQNMIQVVTRKKVDESELKKLKEAIAISDNEICDVLAEAVGGFTRHCDFPKDSPAYAEENTGYFVGEHIAIAMAELAAKKLTELKTVTERLADVLSRYVEADGNERDDLNQEGRAALAAYAEEQKTEQEKKRVE